MTDILFITPTLENTIDQESIGTLLLASILQGNGLNSKIFPFFRFGNPDDFETFLNGITDAICREQPRIVSFYTRCDSYHIMIKIAQAIKSRCNAYVVFGGPQADIVATDTLLLIPWVDYICCGEGENTIIPFFQSLLSGEPDHSIDGLVYRSEDKVICNPRPELIPNLDSLPQINYALSPIPPEEFLKDYFPVDVGRGCPFSCTYCSTNTFWGRKYRLKSPQRLVQEIKELNRQFGITKFGFMHDMFTLNRNQVMETCRLIKSLDFPISWKCSARLDCIDEELIDIMSDAGMNKIFIGIETGSPRMQKITNKNLKLDDVVEKIQYICNKNIKVLSSFIYGFPEESEEDLSDTISLISKLLQIKGSSCTVHLCTFLPGTRLSAQYASELSFAKAFSNITGSIGLGSCEELIQQYPVLFPHFREFQTPLRSKLEYFDIFIASWQKMRPVYQYIRRKYDDSKLVQMYFDFVERNREILEAAQLEDVGDTITKLIADHGFIKSLEEDPLYDILLDYHKMKTMLMGAAIKKKREAGIFCFDAADILQQTPLEEIKREKRIVSFICNTDGKIQVLSKKL